MPHDHTLDQRCEQCADWPMWWLDLAIRLHRLGVLMTESNTQQAQLDQDVTAIGANVASIVSELKAQINANPSAPVSSLDLSSLDALAASTQAEATADAPAAPAAPAAAPAAPADPAPAVNPTPTPPTDVPVAGEQAPAAPAADPNAPYTVPDVTTPADSNFPPPASA